MKGAYTATNDLQALVVMAINNRYTPARLAQCFSPELTHVDAERLLTGQSHFDGDSIIDGPEFDVSDMEEYNNRRMRNKRE